jgi:hypothetical protein
VPRIAGYPNGVKVLRIIEYEYENPERAESDMAMWTHSKVASGMRMRSAVLPFEAINWIPEESDA